MSSLILLFVLLAPFCGKAEAGLNEFFEQANESLKSLSSILSTPAQFLSSLFGGTIDPPKPKHVKRITAEVADGSEVITIVRGPPSHTGISHIFRQQRRPQDPSASKTTDEAKPIQELYELLPERPLQGSAADPRLMPPAGLVNRQPGLINTGGLMRLLPPWLG